MNSPLLTLPILNKFLDLIVSYQDFVQINDKGLLELIKFVDKEESFWKIEDNLLWKKKCWLQNADILARKRRESEVINNIKDERKSALKALQFKLAEISGLEPEKLLDMALSMLHKKKVETAALLGIDISNLPDMPVNYIIIDGNVEYRL